MLIFRGFLVDIHIDELVNYLANIAGWLFEHIVFLNGIISHLVQIYPEITTNEANI